MARKSAPKSRADGRTAKGTFAPGISGRSLARQDAFVKDGVPQVVPVHIRNDGWSNFFTGAGVFGKDKRTGAKFHADVLSFDEMRELAQGDDLAKRAAETLPREAFRQGWDLIITAEEGDNDEEDRVQEILEVLNKLGAKTYIKQALAWERIFGGGTVLLGVNDGQGDLSKPLNLAAVKSIDWLTPLEPREVMPVYGYADLKSPKYGQPEIYRITSRTQFPDKNGTYSQQTIDIHETRMLIFPGSRVSRYQPAAQSGGWGDSIYVPMWRVLRDFNLTWAAAGALVSDFSSAVYKFKDLWETLGSDDAEEFQRRIASMELTRSTINATVIDAEDDFSRTSSSVAGLPDLLDKFATRLAAAADMPLTLLFGTSPGGLNATGESDIRFFYDRVSEYQEERVLPQLKKLVQIVMRCTGVKAEPKKWDITFRPLWQESAKDKASAMLTQAQADAAWIGAGVLSAEEVAAAHWQSGKYNPDITVDFDARERQEQVAPAPINQKDLNAVDPDHPDYKGSSLDPNNNNYIEPPPGSALAQAAKPPGAGGKPGNPFAKGDRLDRYTNPFLGRDGKIRRELRPATEVFHPESLVHFDYSPDQERDESGRFAGGGAGSSRTTTVHAEPFASLADMPEDHPGNHFLATITANHGLSDKHGAIGGRTRIFQAHPTEVGDKEFKVVTQPTRNGQIFTGTGAQSSHATLAEAHAAGNKALDKQAAYYQNLAAKALVKTAKAKGGFTVNPKSGESPTSGYSVAVHGDRERKLVGKNAITPEAIGAYVKDNHDVLLRDPQAHIGGWYNPDDDTWYLDVPHVEKDLSTAAQLGHDNKQLGIYDLKRGETINAQEYPDAIAKTGRFHGRLDASRTGSRSGSSNHDTRRNGRGHEGAPEANPRRTGSDGRLDYSPDQERDGSGRWTSGGGDGGSLKTPASSPSPSPSSSWKGRAAGAKDTISAYKREGHWDHDRQLLHDNFAKTVTQGVGQCKPGEHTVYMTGGGPAAGKTSGLLMNPNAGIPGKGQAVFVSADDAKEWIPEYKAGLAAGNPGSAGFVHEESSAMSQQAFNRAMEHNQNVVYDSTGDGGIEKLSNSVQNMRNQGANRVVANYATLDLDEAMKRAEARGRATGRFVPTDVLIANHQAVNSTMLDAMDKGIFDSQKIWDTSGHSPVLVASYDRVAGKQIHDHDAYERLLKRAGRAS